MQNMFKWQLIVERGKVSTDKTQQVNIQTSSNFYKFDLIQALNEKILFLNFLEANT